MSSNMAAALLIIAALAVAGLLALWRLAAAQKARWQERAGAAEKQLKQIRQAHEIKNAVAHDPDFRERVRRHFDRP